MADKDFHHSSGWEYIIELGSDFSYILYITDILCCVIYCVFIMFKNDKCLIINNICI